LLIRMPEEIRTANSFGNAALRYGVADTGGNRYNEDALNFRRQAGKRGNQVFGANCCIMPHREPSYPEPVS